MILGFGSKDVWWVAIAGVVGSYAAWFGIKTRLGLRWLLNRARRGFVDWFGESIDKHVAPKFEEIRVELFATTDVIRQSIRAETEAAATVLRTEMSNTATRLKVELDERAAEETKRLGEIVHAEIAEPISEGISRIEQKIDNGGPASS